MRTESKLGLILDVYLSVSAGSPAFVIQEEFDRYVGFWWRPVAEERAGRRELLFYLELASFSPAALQCRFIIVF